MPLPELVDHDTLLFAPALAAHCGAVRPVVDELLAAANDPDRLQGVDPTLTRIRAADLLSLEHDPALLDDAVAMLREAVALALPDEIGLAQDALAKMLAEQGNVAELDALAGALLREAPSLPWAQQLSGISTISAVFGYGKHADGWLTEALPMVGTGRSSLPIRQRRADRVIRDVLEDAKRRLARIRAAISADGRDPDDPAAARERMHTRPTPAMTIESYPPWPAGFQGRLVWWPEPDYVRLIRQMPELGTVLGEPWHRHTARVQAAMTGSSMGQAGTASASPADRSHSLVAAEFSHFAEFLGWFRADPLAPATMTAFGVLGSKLPAPVKWPPRQRGPCWCGSGNQYRECCARRGAP